MTRPDIAAVRNTPAVPDALESGVRGKTPSLVFLHGIGGGSAGWAPQLAHCVQQGRHALAWDMPGYGRSPMIEPYDFPGLARALEHLLDQHALDRAVLIGHSLGGMVALQAWTQMPQRIHALVLAATSPAFGHGSGDFQQQFLAQRLAPLDAGHSLADVARTLVPAMMGPAPDPQAQTRAQACMAAIPAASYRAALHALVTFEQRAALPTVTVPTLCIAGAHDRTAAPSVMQRMASKIPGARYVEMPDAGHLLNFEQPDAFNQLIDGFVAAHTAHTAHTAHVS
jgi:3-oxoadipate enol-lactonase